ncbi:hypothetical protein GGX14DRAFT_384645 [Mycena pura]|uniref:Uncharacterized protein n=1 Tax=Mycena pura TaxID=153505 RepID=A0AAD6YWD9_9AGAR|nr:hypothetical protein GGX14DRAFT_384645 [Mycena pura]
MQHSVRGEEAATASRGRQGCGMIARGRGREVSKKVNTIAYTYAACECENGNGNGPVPDNTEWEMDAKRTNYVSSLDPGGKWACKASGADLTGASKVQESLVATVAGTLEAVGSVKREAKGRTRSHKVAQGPRMMCKDLARAHAFYGAPTGLGQHGRDWSKLRQGGSWLVDPQVALRDLHESGTCSGSAVGPTATRSARNSAGNPLREPGLRRPHPQGHPFQETAIRLRAQSAVELAASFAAAASPSRGASSQRAPGERLCRCAAYARLHQTASARTWARMTSTVSAPSSGNNSRVCDAHGICDGFIQATMGRRARNSHLIFQSFYSATNASGLEKWATEVEGMHCGRPELERGRELNPSARVQDARGWPLHQAMSRWAETRTRSLRPIAHFSTFQGASSRLGRLSYTCACTGGHGRGAVRELARLVAGPGAARMDCLCRTSARAAPRVLAHYVSRMWDKGVGMRACYVRGTRGYVVGLALSNKLIRRRLAFGLHAGSTSECSPRPYVGYRRALSTRHGLTTSDDLTLSDSTRHVATACVFPGTSDMLALAPARATQCGRVVVRLGGESSGTQLNACTVELPDGASQPPSGDAAHRKKKFAEPRASSHVTVELELYSFLTETGHGTSAIADTGIPESGCVFCKRHPHSRNGCALRHPVAPAAARSTARGASAPPVPTACKPSSGWGLDTPVPGHPRLGDKPPHARSAAAAVSGPSGARVPRRLMSGRKNCRHEAGRTAQALCAGTGGHGGVEERPRKEATRRPASLKYPLDIRSADILNIRSISAARIIYGYSEYPLDIRSISGARIYFVARQILEGKHAKLETDLREHEENAKSNDEARVEEIHKLELIFQMQEVGGRYQEAEHTHQKALEDLSQHIKDQEQLEEELMGLREREENTKSEAQKLEENVKALERTIQGLKQDVTEKDKKVQYLQEYEKSKDKDNKDQDRAKAREAELEGLLKETETKYEKAKKKIHKLQDRVAELEQEIIQLKIFQEKSEATHSAEEQLTIFEKGRRHGELEASTKRYFFCILCKRRDQDLHRG